MNIKGRLKYIYESIENIEYTNIIDTCCDHGYLGSFLATKFLQSKIYLVDINAEIIKKLKRKTFQENVEVLCEDAHQIDLKKEKTLIIIAGVGGELAVKIIKGILKKNTFPSLIDFIVVANNKGDLIRNAFNQLDFGCVKQGLIFEKKIGYELLYARYKSGEVFDLVGKEMFDVKNCEHKIFVEKKREFYHIKSTYDNTAKDLYVEYEKLLKSF
jgi:tRNA (adenine22-N1)-methyltransferase